MAATVFEKGDVFKTTFQGKPAYGIVIERDQRCVLISSGDGRLHQFITAGPIRDPKPIGSKESLPFEVSLALKFARRVVEEEEKIAAEIKSAMQQP
jgi:hypothetical protein